MTSMLLEDKTALICERSAIGGAVARPSHARE
jgi:hypothetical protein